MAKQFDNSFIAFSRPLSIFPQIVLGGGVFLVLFTGLAVSVSSGSWPFAAIFSLSITGMAVYSFYAIQQANRLRAAKDQARIDWEAAGPDVQRASLNIEVIELSRLLEVDADQISDLQSAYIVAEDLALRQIQHEENVPLLRHVSIGRIPFDAVFIKNDFVFCCEVTFLVAPELRKEKVDAVMRKAARTKAAFEQMNIGMKIRLVMILITQLTPEDEERLRAVLDKRRFSKTPVDIDIRLLDFEALQRMYVTDR
jgi:hypothetical protein